MAGLIRAAQIADAAALAALWSPWISQTAITFNSEPKTPQMLAEMIEARQAAGHGFLVACQGAQLLGFASYSQFRAGPGYSRSMEHTVILAPEAQGQGCGRALMTALEDHGRAAGHHMMIGAVSAENPGGRAFHQALGYQVMGCLPQVGFKFGRYMDLCLLGKLL